MLNYFNSGLRVKLVLLVVAGIVSAFTVIGAFRVHIEKQQITAEMRHSGQERVEMIGEAVANLLVGYNDPASHFAPLSRHPRRKGLW